MDKVMVGVTEYGEGMDVKLGHDKGRLVIVASNEAGYSSTFVDLIQVLEWVKINMPDVMLIPKPLTEESVRLLIGGSDAAQSWVMTLVRAVEKAHGIGEKD